MVKWDAATDQIVSHITTINLTSDSLTPSQLLLKILETSKVNADVKAIAEAWRKYPPTLPPKTFSQKRYHPPPTP